jgi:prepilin-type N-terminal cleavage/methylation domain-containing protein
MQKSAGFTLVELLISIAIGGLIFSIAAAAIYQLSSVTTYGSSRLEVLHDQQNAAFWFSQDGQQSLTASVNSGLIFKDGNGVTTTYRLSGTNLERVWGNSVQVLSQNISSAGFSVNQRLVSMHLVSSIAGRTEDGVDKTYQVYLRAVQ